MGQKLVFVCHTCKKITYQKTNTRELLDGYFDENVAKYLVEHKYHNIRPCGSDGGGEIQIDKYRNEGYEIKNE